MPLSPSHKTQRIPLLFISGAAAAATILMSTAGCGDGSNEAVPRNSSADTILSDPNASQALKAQAVQQQEMARRQQQLMRQQKPPAATRQ